MTRIARPIGKADLEFYEPALVLAVARAMAPRGWEQLSDRARTHWLDRAVYVLQNVLSERSVVERLPLLAENLMSRVE